jgi:biopolymer transport protein ExbB/TolQ
MMAVFLVVAGYTDTQIAPVMGLLGTVAGYLLGKEPKEP